jgi:hypothetical protein
MVLTAKEWGWSPTAVIRQAKDPRKPHPADYNFAHAVETLLEEKCPKCGVPIWYAFSTNSEIAFKLKSITCQGCLHKETETKDQELKPGESHVVYAVPADAEDDPEAKLPPRSDYFERAAKEHAAEHERLMKRRAKAEAQQQ